MGIECTVKFRIGMETIPGVGMVTAFGGTGGINAMNADSVQFICEHLHAWSCVEHQIDQFWITTGLHAWKRGWGSDLTHNPAEANLLFSFHLSSIRILVSTANTITTVSSYLQIGEALQNQHVYLHLLLCSLHYRTAITWHDKKCNKGRVFSILGTQKICKFF